jgi:hypothetical protein
MRGVAVGLYCAVVDRFDPSVSAHLAATHETQTVLDGRIGGPRTWLGRLNLGSVEAMLPASDARPPIHRARPFSWAGAVRGFMAFATCSRASNEDLVGSIPPRPAEVLENIWRFPEDLRFPGGQVAGRVGSPGYTHVKA